MLHVLDGEAEILPPGYDRAIVTLCIGARHRGLWERMSRPGWLAYGARHGYDIIQITAPLDRSALGQARSPAWQKCLVLQQPWARHYRRIVWLDSDIVITGQARDILETQPDPARIGVCPSGEQLSPAELHIYLERFHALSLSPAQVETVWGMHVGNQFSNAGLPAEGATMFNTGVLVLSPPHHAPLLRALYDRADPDNELFEQPMLSQTICRERLDAPLSARFNWSMHEATILRFATQPVGPFGPAETAAIMAFVADEMQKGYFVHFCGSMPLLTWLAERAPGAAG